MPSTEEELQAEREAIFEFFWGAFEKAERSAGPCHWYGRLAGGTVHLRSAGPFLLHQVVPALAHREQAPAPADLTVALWDSRSSGHRLPLLLQTFVEYLKRTTWESLETRHEISVLKDERFCGAYRLGPQVNILSLLDRATSRALYWMEDARFLPYWETSSPLQMILNWWAESCNLQYVHAAAVGHPDGAVLLTGPGGSGKSSTALACLNSDLRYLADDYCLVRADPARVYSLYCTAKLKGAADFARFPELASWVGNPDREPQDKAVLNLQQHRPEKLLDEAPLRALVVPTVRAGQQDSQLVPIRGAQALLALAPSTLFQLAGTHQESLSRMTRLVRQVPCYSLQLGSDTQQLPSILRGLLLDRS